MTLREEVLHRVEHGKCHSGATYSPCRQYRYTLWRRWDRGETIAFCMLNPSTATELVNDPTVERCERRARAWGYGKLIVVNLFAWRSTDPHVLKTLDDPVGPDNFRAIVAALKDSQMFVCAWGKHGSLLGIGEIVLTRIHEFFPGRAHALKLNLDGSPAHPLYLPYHLTPEPMRR